MDTPNLPTLTLGFCTRDDYAGAWMTINAALAFHADQIAEIVIVDNSPAGSPHADQLQKHVAALPIVNYLPDPGPPSSCLYKDKMFQAATSDVVVCCDSHVLFPPESLARLRAWFAAHPDSPDLITGPLMESASQVNGTHHQIYETEESVLETDGKPFDRTQIHHGTVWRGGSAGVWRNDPRGQNPAGEPFEIQQQGTGAFACRRAIWPGFHPQFWGHGGNETWLMERIRERGGRVFCLPGFRWIHRYGDPDGRRYPMEWHDRVRNYLIAAQDLDRPDWWDATRDYFRTICPKTTDAAIKRHPRPRGLLDELRAIWPAGQVDESRSGTIPAALFHQLRRRVHGLGREGRVLEFGAGLSTLLCDRLGIETVSVEHDPAWIDRVRPLLTSGRVDLQHHAITDTDPPWYGWRPTAGDQFDLVLIDGPPGSIGRAGILNYLADCLAPAATILIDDTHRPAEQQLSTDLAEMYAFTVERVRLPASGRAFDILTRTVDESAYTEGPGTELKAILSQRFGMTPIASCGCNGKIRQLNYRGPNWIKANKKKVIGWLLDGARTWQALGPDDRPASWLTLVPDFAKSTGISVLIDAALSNWERKLPSPPTLTPGP